MFGIGGGELFFILVIILMLFGSDKVPEMARTLGKFIAQVKNATNDIKSEINKSAEESGITKDIKDALQVDANPLKDIQESLKVDIDPVKDIQEALNVDVNPIQDIQQQIQQQVEDIELMTGPIKRQS
ncbi:MAG: twin-arginine translocase TatA/TatE family subunit [Flavobacteriaceae bacterium]|jgi:sec-independent protein translocase protein TatA|nr:twin-arginine translocase TatA/TatE family subunit [Flavobacteriaceae bacterium]